MAKTFRKRTAMGADWLSPRDIGKLSDPLLELYVQLWALSLKLVRLPVQWALLIIALIPKPDSTEDRPIGIFPTMTRCIGRWYRRSVGQRWLGTVDSPIHFGTAGRSTQWAVWQKAAASEYAHSVGKSALSILLDIKKAFEHVRHELLVTNAQLYNFSLHMLRWLLYTYGLERRITVSGVVAPGTFAWRT